MERRLTIFPGTSNPHLIRKRAEINLPALPTPPTLSPSISEIPVPTYTRRSIPHPKIPVNVSSASQSSFKRPKAERNFAQEKDPWLVYHTVLTEDQAGPVTLAYRQEPAFPIVAIKERKKTVDDPMCRLYKTSHPNVVALQEVFLNQNTLYFMYESMVVSLAAIQASPCGNLAAYEIATVIQVLHGLQYIHKELKVIHGAVNCDNILLSAEGDIKLANIGDSMLRQQSIENSRSDLQQMGYVMMKLMQPGTILRNPSAQELEQPHNWDENIQLFLKNMFRLSLDILIKEAFLEVSPGVQCFKPHIIITERAMYKDWKIVRN